MQIRKNITMIRDMIAGSTALVGMHVMSPGARVHFSWLIIDRIARVCALDVMHIMAEERSLDEVPPEGMVSEPCRDIERTDHVHWVPADNSMIHRMLRPLIDQIEDELMMERVRKQLADAFKKMGEGDTAAVPFDMTIFEVDLDDAEPVAPRPVKDSPQA